MIELAIDKNGQLYTEHTFGKLGDPWYGATILLPTTVARLEREGLLPLEEVPPEPTFPGHPDDWTDEEHEASLAWSKKYGTLRAWRKYMEEND